MDAANSTEKQRAFLVAVGLPHISPDDLEDSLRELAGLVDTAGAVVVGTEIQNRLKPSGALFIGKGKAQELEEQRAAGEFDLLVFDVELSPSQLRNLEDIIDCPIVDRTTVILDIFALRAKSREAKLQVEIAQMKHRLTRLTGKGTDLSRLAGGIGTRGPGLTKLETDRRRIRDKIAFITKELEGIKDHRELLRKQRSKNPVPVIALAGYTNAGKSTLHQVLSGSDTYVDDRLFATLDVVARRVESDNAQPYVLIDTVGFIRKLPHQLIAAFRSTLEEIEVCDIIIHVVDSTSHQMETEIRVVEEVLSDMEITDRPRILVFNKVDLLAVQDDIFQLTVQYPDSIAVSAVRGLGIEELKEAVQEAIFSTRQEAEFKIPFAKFSLLDTIHSEGTVTSREDEPDGVRIKAILSPVLAARIERELQG